MKISILVLLIASVLSLTQSQWIVHRRRRYGQAPDKRVNPYTVPSIPTYLIYDINPPLLGSLCNSTWNGGIQLNSLPGRNQISEKCKQIYDAIAPSTLWTGHQVVPVEWVWICPDEVHGAMPPAPKDPKKSHPMKFTIIGADFPVDRHVTMAMLNFTIASHKPPIEVDDVQVQVGYDVVRAGPREIFLVKQLM